MIAVRYTYRPGWRELYSIPEARARILRRLAETPDGLRLEQLLPEESAAAGIPAEPVLKQRAAWTSTFVASPRARASSASRTATGVATVTQRLVFGSVHRIVPRSTATLRTSGRAARTASALTRSASIRPRVMAVIASVLMITVICFGGWRRRAARVDVAGPNSVPWSPDVRIMWRF